MGEIEASTLETTGVASKQVLATMRRVDRREWWLWSSAISVTILLAMGIGSFALPALFSGPDGLDSFFLPDGAVRGLMGLVLIFNVYVIYEQLQIHRLRRELANQLYEMSVLDPLTGLFNRRYIQHRLEEEIARSQRHGTPLTAILFDLDGFKEVNDEHGHVAGDDLLKAFAEQLKRATRGSDVAARYGGDEFLAILSDCEQGGVQYVLQRLTGLRVQTHNGNLPVFYSAGWTNYVLGETLEEFLKRADKALYADKRSPNKSSAIAAGAR
jgi:diguanylate cyclase (GGDEF)-like protein